MQEKAWVFWGLVIREQGGHTLLRPCPAGGALCRPRRFASDLGLLASQLQRPSSLKKIHKLTGVPGQGFEYGLQTSSAGCPH